MGLLKNVTLYVKIFIAHQSSCNMCVCVCLSVNDVGVGGDMFRKIVRVKKDRKENPRENRNDIIVC